MTYEGVEAVIQSGFQAGAKVSVPVENHRS